MGIPYIPCLVEAYSGISHNSTSRHGTTIQEASIAAFSGTDLVMRRRKTPENANNTKSRRGNKKDIPYLPTVYPGDYTLGIVFRAGD